MSIKILDEKTIKKIAAGEVIERPASVVKEMLENSIDAGATSIFVEVSGGGMDQILISDNGSGINEEEIHLAFERHATSKIQTFDDLYHTYSLGFRGEALASILAISNITVKTRTKESTTGTEVIFIDGIESKRSPIAMSIGTTMNVQGLFHNVPVRKKFIQSERVENNHITQVMYRQAIGNPNITIRYRRDGKTIFVAPKTQDILENLSSLFGKELADHMLLIDVIEGSVHIKGYVSDNLYYRGNRSMQYLYVNGRYIENRDITDTIESAYKQIIPNGKFPAFFLNITIDSEEIDVNVHPNKQAIKFSNFENLIIFLSNAIQDVILFNQKTNLPSMDKEGIKLPTLEDLKKTYDYKSILETYHPTKTTNSEDNDSLSYTEQKEFDLVRERPLMHIEVPKDEEDTLYDDKNLKTINVANLKPQWDEMNWKFIGSVFDTYLLFETQDLLYAVDQHAAHERIQFEILLDQFNRSAVIVQPMLAPIIINLTDDEMTTFNDNIDAYSKLGFEFTFFGERAVAIRSIPQLLEKNNVSDMISQLLDASQKPYDHLATSWNEHLIMAACKSAVKAGDALNKKEVDHLMRKLFTTKQPYTCPHGRPILLKLTRYDLEKIFSRIK